MTVCGIEIDPEKLMSKQELLDFLRDVGGNDCGLSDIRSRYAKAFGKELTWRYPISDGNYMGTVIVAVREGFLGLPYDFVDREVYEIYELDNAHLLDAESVVRFILDFEEFANDLLGAMGDMMRILV